MWIKLLKDRDFTPPDERRVTIAYKAGMELSVKRAWGMILIAEGSAEEISTPPRPPADADGDGHDDATGQFVDGNKVARRRKRPAA